jgi:hypothetical protein
MMNASAREAEQSKMTNITKTYKISNWVEFTEVESAATVGPATTTVIKSRMGNHPVKITTTMREDGSGHEVRSFDVA